jgi:hypothetical protein
MSSTGAEYTVKQPPTKEDKAMEKITIHWNERRTVKAAVGYRTAWRDIERVLAYQVNYPGGMKVFVALDNNKAARGKQVEISVGNYITPTRATTYDYFVWNPNIDVTQCQTAREARTNAARFEKMHGGAA